MATFTSTWLEVLVAQTMDICMTFGGTQKMDSTSTLSCKFTIDPVLALYSPTDDGQQHGIQWQHKLLTSTWHSGQYHGPHTSTCPPFSAWSLVVV